MTEIKGKMTYERDSKRYHRFDIETESGVVGTIYIPKDLRPLPDRICLDRADNKQRGGD